MCNDIHIPALTDQVLDHTYLLSMLNVYKFSMIFSTPGFKDKGMACPNYEYMHDIQQL
jgi:hypothetical protein